MLKEMLYAAADAGEIIEVIYQGGSSPGTIRKLLPIQILDDRVRARDMDADGMVKTYLIKRITLPGQLSLVKQKTREFSTSIKQSTKSLVSTWENHGWHVKIGENEASLTRYFKNGKLRKTPDIGIAYFPDNRHPYYVYGPGLVPSSRTYSKIDRAINTLINQANRYTPDNYDTWPKTISKAKEREERKKQKAALERKKIDKEQREILDFFNIPYKKNIRYLDARKLIDILFDNERYLERWEAHQDALQEEEMRIEDERFEREMRIDDAKEFMNDYARDFDCYKLKKKQIIAVLDALEKKGITDDAWDLDPVIFFDTALSLFPELKKH